MRRRQKYASRGLKYNGMEITHRHEDKTVHVNRGGKKQSPSDDPQINKRGAAG